jgi:hypothetical protein
LITHAAVMGTVGQLVGRASYARYALERSGWVRRPRRRSGSEAADHRQYLATGVTDNRGAMADAGDLEIQLGLLADCRDRIGGV